MENGQEYCAMSSFITCKNVVIGIKNPLNEKAINCSIALEERIILQGDNGIGKTTLLRSILNLQPLIQGDITINDCSIQTMKRYKIGREIGYLHQQPAFQLFAMTVWQELVLYLSFRDEMKNIEDKAHKIAQRLKIDHLYNNHPQLCSKGEQQRIALASILLQEPKFLLLDEPTAALDDESVQLLLETIHEHKIGYVMVSHDFRVSLKGLKLWTLTQEGLHEEL